MASLATYGVFRTIKSIPVREVEVATRHIVVAAENLPLGTRLSKEQVKLVGWPAATPVDGSFTSVDEIVGRGLIQPVLANEPVTESRLAPKEAGFIAGEAKFLKSIAHVGTKTTLPAPALLGERLWDAERSRKAYPRREDFVRDCVAPLRRGEPERATLKRMLEVLQTGGALLIAPEGRESLTGALEAAKTGAAFRVNRSPRRDVTRGRNRTAS